jgi:hypothetical protein
MRAPSLPIAALFVAAGCGGSVEIVEYWTRAPPSEAGDDAGGSGTSPPPPAMPDAGDSGEAAAAPESGVDAPEGDAPGGIVTLASGQNNPLQIAADSQYVYWTNAGTQASEGRDGAVLRVAVSGGTPVTLWVGPAFAVALDAARVYWTGGGSVMSLPLQGGTTPTTLVSGQAGGPNAIASDGTSVYWVNSTSNANLTSSVRKVAVSGGSPVTLATGLVSPSSVAVDGQNVYWGEGTAAPDVDGGAPCVKSLPVGGGSVTTLVASTLLSGGGPAPAVAVHDPDVYAAFQLEGNALGLVRVPTTGGAAVTLAPEVDGYLAVDGTSAYWTVSETSAVFKVPVAGGAPVVVASDQAGPGAIAVNDASVFWTTSNVGGAYGAIMKAEK